MARHVFVADDKVMAVFTECLKREREDLLKIFKALAESPYQTGEWRQKTKSGGELQVKRFGKWLVSFWLDDPVLEIRIVDIKKLVP
ncbi:MAG TPA: hypothetical protein VH597_14075 [Verrucomicrobiae bacterium]|jgi:hypothetical protein|nr:hypothetical protein [Verrucomicrobiae bacterium]